MDKPPQNPLVQIEEKAVKKIEEKRDTYAQKYPILFAFGAGFGLVCTFYGFEKIIDQFDFFTDNPWVLLLTGVSLLVVTGSFYNKLS